MIIRVLYFALLRERLRTESEPLDCPEGTTAAAALELLCARHEIVRAVRRSLQVAVNLELVDGSHVMREGDELALIPPVAGGAASHPRCRLSSEPLVYQEVLDAVTGPGQGGLVLFAGLVRDHNRGHSVVELQYQAYDAMALHAMSKIAAALETELPGTRVAIHHRTGTLAIGELAVLIAASAPHRGEAFTACREAIERLKREVPIWKRELSPDGAEWLDSKP